MTRVGLVDVPIFNLKLW